MQTGSNKIVISGLPSAIDTHSLRVSGLDGTVRLSDVTCIVNKAKDTASDTTSEQIRVLKVKKNTLEAERLVREREAELLVGYAKTITAEHVKPSEMEAFLKSFVSQGNASLGAANSLKEQIHEIEKQIEKEKEESQLRKGDTRTVATIVLTCDNATQTKMTLTYSKSGCCPSRNQLNMLSSVVSNASWTPTYELHAKTENGMPSSNVSLHYRARVSQSTGEDWKDVALTVSTVSFDLFRGGAKGIPRLPKIKINPRIYRPPTGGLFGNNALKGGFGFGATQSAFGGGPFGQAQQPPQQQQQQQQQPVSLFGSNTQGTSLFGANNAGPSAFGTSSVPLGGFTAPAHANTPPVPAEDPEIAAEDDARSSFEEITLTSDGPGSSEAGTIIKETPLAISYSVDGLSSIPSDDVSHQVEMAILPFESKITHVVVPRKEARVYLQVCSLIIVWVHFC
jgi:hypothetical protein